MSHRHLSLALCVALSAGAVGAQVREDQNKHQNRLAECGVVMTAREIITGTTVKMPPSGDALVNVLQKRAPHNQSETSGRGVRR